MSGGDGQPVGAAIRIEDVARHPAFVRLHTLHGVRVDLRYVGSNNFAGRRL